MMAEVHQNRDERMKSATDEEQQQEYRPGSLVLEARLRWHPL